MANTIEDSRIDLYVRVNRVIPDNSKFKFTPISFKIFMLIENEQSLHKVYKLSNVDRESFDQAIISLSKQGLIQEVEVNDRFIGQDDIEKIKSALNIYIGPWGELLFKDTLEILGFSQDRIPELKLPLLINSIVDQIPSNKAIQFKESIEYLVDQYVC
ncbi:MAG: hypothetical protein P8010_11840 [Desulfosarcinaceae bacterium]|jgi:hypothetical protein